MLVQSRFDELYQLEDKRVLLLRDLSVAVVVGYQHPPGNYVAYIKYVYTGKGIWRGYERVVKRYSPTDVMVGRIVYDPNFSSEVPVVSKSEIVSAPDPLRRMMEIVKSPKEDLEERALEVKEKVRGTLGIGGSLLLKIHHKKSDLDMLVYDRYEDIWYELKDFGEDEIEWVINVSKRLGLDPEYVYKNYYSKAIRSVYKGIPLSFSYVKKGFREKYGTFPRPTNRIFEGKIELDDPDERTFLYPHVRRGSINIISFESAFLRPMVECDKLWVRGKVFSDGDREYVVLGIKEYFGSMKPASICR